MLRSLRRSIFLSFFIFVTYFPSISQAGEISPGLQSILQSSAPSEEIPVIINLSAKVDITFIQDGDKNLRRARIIRALKENADLTQGQTKAFLQTLNLTRIIPLWITNGIAATVPAWVIPEIADFPQVESITLDSMIQAPPVTPAADAPPEWNISAIQAPSLWNIGMTGTGSVVASMDTGVDINHVDLQSKWRGGANSWFNPYSDPANAANCATPNHCTPCEANSATPCDTAGHGTGTMGIMVGGSGGGTAIGVAPDSKWIAVKIFNGANAAAHSIIHQGFQWILDLPEGQAPDVVNNSWGLESFPAGPGVCDLTFQPDIEALKTAGISVVFAAGNRGPFPATSISPANNAGSFAVGATDNTNTIAPFSSRGPAPSVAGCGNGSIFPQVVAPGLNVKTSSITNGGLFPNSYVTVSGTSFSTPHAAGVMALLSGAFSTLTPSQLESILEQTALGLGTPVPNNDYGYGLVDAVNAYENVFDAIKGDIPEIASLPPLFDFGNVEILASPSNLFTVVNRGIADLSITDITVTGADSSEFIKQNPGDNCSGQTIPPLSSCTVQVLFSPLSVGPKDAALAIQSDDPVQPLLDVPLSASVFALIPGPTVSAPAIAWNETAQKLHIAIRGANGSSISVGSLNSSGLFNNDWTQIPGNTSDAPAISWNETAQKLHITVRGTNGSSIWVGSTNSNGVFNSDWTKIPGGTSDAPAIAWNEMAQKLHIAVRGSNGSSIWVGSTNSNGVFNNDWTKIPGGTSDAPAIAWNETAQKLHIAVRGSNGSSIWVGSTNSNGVFNNDWTKIPGGTSDAPAIAWDEAAQKLRIAVRGSNGSSIWVGSTHSNGVFNNDWTQLAGTSPSAPSAAFNSLDDKLHVIFRKADNSIEEWAIGSFLTLSPELPPTGSP